MLFKKEKVRWYNFGLFHKQQNIWESYEPLWFVLISLSIVTLIAFSLRAVITHQTIGEESLYISPSSYSFEATDFFMEKTGFSQLDIFGISAAQAQETQIPKTNEEKIKIIIIHNKNDIAHCPNL